MMIPNERLVAGKRLPRLDGPAKTTGRLIYSADFALPGMLYAKVLRSPFAHARLVRIVTDRAAAMPGVKCIVTAADIPAVRYGNAVKDMTVFATDRVSFVGHPIAAVAATSLESAEEAVQLIEVEFEELPPLLNPEEAMKADAPPIHPEFATYKVAPFIKASGNVAGRSAMHHGDVAAAFANAHRVYEHRFTTPLVHAGYTEPRVATAAWDGSSLNVWSSTQLPFDIQTTLADIFQIPSSQVRVVVPGIGGGFGAKLRIGIEQFAAVCARASGRPVKIISTSEEELTASNPRQSSIVTLKTGVDRDGHILAREGRVILDCGAWAGSGPATAAIALQILIGPYRTPAFH
ncbi:MAG: molybdopterin-dependent oxidoreductase, partial [Methylobacteriaceae bacterium]|nr:molybdopterin-dependent oxidoreductase [Methylobacteriaceae bacterium]